MSIFHIYCECGAFGDTALNLCRAHTAMSLGKHNSTIVHASPFFLINETKTKIPNKSEVITIYENCNFIDKVEIDVDLFDGKSIYFSEKYLSPIEQPMLTRDYNYVLDWIDLKKFLPVFPSFEKVAVFQPVSLTHKPPQYHEEYVPIWNRCLETLIRNNFQIVMVGGEDDPFEKCFNKKYLKYIDNKIGKWSFLESLSFLLYYSDLVLACDSWTAVWGIAARKKTFASFGYLTEIRDSWVLDFLGNKDCYEIGWSSQKEYSDAFLADKIYKYISKKHK